MTPHPSSFGGRAIGPLGDDVLCAVQLRKMSVKVAGQFALCTPVVTDSTRHDCSEALDVHGLANSTEVDFHQEKTMKFWLSGTKYLPVNKNRVSGARMRTARS